MLTPQQRFHSRAVGFALASGVAAVWLVVASVGLIGTPTLGLSESNHPDELESFGVTRRLDHQNRSHSDDEIPGWYSTHCTDGVSDWGGGTAFGLILATIFLFCGLGLVCDEWFVPSLEMISEKLQLSPDVAGATFLAAGSSAPELFTSVADTFAGESEGFGMGTIVGSAMFNILVIVALSAAATTEVLTIDWRPVCRDCGFYSLSIILLIIFMIDGEIATWEGVIMVICYGLYITFMVFNERIFNLCPPPDKSKDRSVPIDSDKNQVEMSKPSETGENSLTVKETLPSEAELGGAKADASSDVAETEPEQAGGEDDDEGDPDNYWDRFEVPDGPIVDKIYWVINFPWLVVFTFTIPDCSKTVGKPYYAITFVLSIVWIGLVCLFMVVCASRIGCIMNVNATVMGICVLAVGTSVPDAMGSMAVAANGEADMAIANAVGSNVFDILLGLGVPWMLNGAIKGATVVDKCGIEVAVFILFSTIGLFFLTLILNKWQMNNRLGLVFFALYIVYYIYSLLTGFKVFNPVQCDEDDDGAH